MSFVENFITPVFTGVTLGFMFLGVVFLLYKVYKKFYKNFKWTLKYKIFKRKYKEEDVKWCVNAINRGMRELDIKRFLMIKGISEKKVNETLYIYNKILKGMKGGDKKNGRK